MIIGDAFFYRLSSLLEFVWITDRTRIKYNKGPWKKALIISSLRRSGTKFASGVPRSVLCEDCLHFLYPWHFFTKVYPRVSTTGAMFLTVACHVLWLSGFVYPCVGIHKCNGVVSGCGVFVRLCARACVRMCVRVRACVGALSFILLVAYIQSPFLFLSITPL